jgi:hypothetical protein
MDNIIEALQSKVTRARLGLGSGGVHDAQLLEDITNLRRVINIVNTYEIDLIESNLDID